MSTWYGSRYLTEEKESKSESDSLMAEYQAKLYFNRALSPATSYISKEIMPEPLLFASALFDPETPTTRILIMTFKHNSPLAYFIL